MVATGRVVARCHRRARSDEDGACVADAAGERLGLAEQDEMLRSDPFHLGERRLEIVTVEDAAHGLVTVLGLRRHLELRDAPVAAAAEHDDDLGRPRRKVDGDVARDEQLRLVHVGVAGTDDLVDTCDHLGPVGERGDCVRAADRPDVVDTEQRRRRGHDARTRGRRHDDDPLDTGGARRHGAHHERRDEAARNIDADRRERHPASFEVDSGLDLEPEVGRALRLVPPTHAVGEVEHRPLRQPFAGDGPRGSDAVEAQRPLRERLVAALAHVGHDLGDRHPSIRSTGTSRIDDAPAASSAGSRRQTSAAGTRLCTATIPGSASGSTLGAREPGTSAQIALERALRRVEHEIARPARVDDAAEHAGELHCFRLRLAGPISTASDSSSVPTERSPFVRNVLPLETRSTIASARPRRGASSTEPCTSTSSIGAGNSSRASRGKLVATRAPRRSSTVAAFDSAGTAASSVHLPKPRR